MLELAGIADIWTYARGRTRDVYNVALATHKGLKAVSEIKNSEALNLPS
jgi:ribosomal protein S5